MSMTLKCIALKPIQFKKLVEGQKTLAPDFILDQDVLSALGVESNQEFQIDYIALTKEFEKRFINLFIQDNSIPLNSSGTLDYESTYGLAQWWSPDQFQQAFRNEAWVLIQKLDPTFQAFSESVIQNRMYLISMIS